MRKKGKRSRQMHSPLRRFDSRSGTGSQDVQKLLLDRLRARGGTQAIDTKQLYSLEREAGIEPATSSLGISPTIDSGALILCLHLTTII
jgi:hypothetical protein